jgi:hypothetical protein
MKFIGIGGGLSSLIVKRPNQNYRNQYVGYTRTRDEGEVVSQVSSHGERKAISQVSRRSNISKIL